MASPSPDAKSRDADSLYHQLESVAIPQLVYFTDQTLSLDFKGYFPDFDSLTPIQGTLQVRHHGNYLAVSVTAQTIATLTCNRCLGQYNHRLGVEAEELIWLQAEDDRGDDEPGLDEDDREGDSLLETLPPNGSFDLAQWLYEQVCLALPSRQVCAQDCPGIALTPEQTGDTGLDRRWLALQNLNTPLS
ncbi:MAG: YceD family protein [Prochlorothrix sp.]